MTARKVDFTPAGELAMVQTKGVLAMRYSLSLVLAAVILAMPLASAAQSFIIKERFVIPVHGMDANTFEVIENDGAGGGQLWCAAGRYAGDELGKRGGTLSVMQPRGPSAAFPGRKSVIFTASPIADPVSSYSLSVRTQGLTFSLAAAQAACRSDPDRIITIRVVRPAQ